MNTRLCAGHRPRLIRLLAMVMGLLLAFGAAAEIPPPKSIERPPPESVPSAMQLSNAGVLNDVSERYKEAAKDWAVRIRSHASWLFWLLATISMAWTFGMMALRKADIGEVVAELVKFTIFTGFFWWLLDNGPRFAISIINSLAQIGTEAAGLPGVLTPSGIVDLGFDVFFKALNNMSAWSPVDSVIGVGMSLAILIVLALIGVNMLLLLVSAWVLAFGGIFFLGFGGSRWTSDMAINYFKTVLGVGAQLMTMTLLVGIGKGVLDEFFGRSTAAEVPYGDLAVLLIVSVVLLALVKTVPALISGIITGASVGAIGGGGFGADVALGAVGGAAAAMATGGAALAAGAANIAGGASAVMAAVQAAGSASGGGGAGGLASAIGGAVSGSAGADSGGEGGGGLAAAMGDAGDGGAGSGGADASGADSGGSDSNNSGSGDPGAGESGAADNTDGAGAVESADAGGASDGTSDPRSGADSGVAGDGTQGGTIDTASEAESDKASVSGAAKRVGVAGALAQGVMAVAKASGARMVDKARARIGDTVGGKVAAAIKAQSAAASAEPAFDGDSLAGETSVDADAETAAFVGKGNDNAGG